MLITGDAKDIPTLHNRNTNEDGVVAFRLSLIAAKQRIYS